MSDPSKTAKQFAELFTKTLADTGAKSGKEQERAYYSLIRFIHHLAQAEDVDACIAQYLDMYRRLSPDDPRSKMIFAVLLSQRIKLSATQLPYLLNLKDILSEKQNASSAIRVRFDQLGQNEQNQVSRDLRDAIDKRPAPPDEPKKTHTDSSKTAKQFAELFTQTLVDTRNKATKEQEGAYYSFTRFIHQLTNTQDIDACIAQYLSMYQRLSPDDPRSKMIFAILLTQRIQQSGADVQYLLNLKDILEGKQQPPSPTRVRFDQLGQNEQNQVKGSLREALNKNTTILDELKKAYADANKQKQASMAELFNFDPLPGGALETSFRALTKKCTQAWNLCAQELSKNNWEQFEATFKEFTDFLKQNNREKLKLFQILKWCRVPYIGTPITAYSGNRTVQTVTQPLGNDLQNEFYFQTVYALFLRANNLVNPALYRYGFSDEEEKLFLATLANALYHSNYRNRLRLGAAKPGEFHRASATRIWLLLFSRSKNLTVVTDDKLLEIAKIYDDAADGKIPAHQLSDKTFNLGQLPHLDWAKNTVWKIGNKVGAATSEMGIIYFENENTGFPRIYLEYTHMKGTLFEIDINLFISRVEATPRLIIWESNKGLLILIAEYWVFLFAMFFPGVGYFNLFLESGFQAVVKQVLLDRIVDKAVSTLTDQAGISSDGVAGTALTVLLDRKKAIGDRVKALENKVGKLAEKELLHEQEVQASRLGQKDLKELGVDTINEEERATLQTEKLVRDKADKDVEKLTQAEQKKLEKEEEKRAKEIAKSRGTASKGTPANPKVHPVERWQTAGPEPADAIRARAELARTLENHMPKDTKVKLPRTPRTEYGRAQNLAATPKGSPAVFDLDIALDFPNGIRRKLGLPLRDPKKPNLGVVGTDGIAFESADKYLILEHKEVETIWENSHFAREATVRQIDEMLLRHLDVSRALRPYGCLGFGYSTNVTQLKILLTERINALRASVKGWFPLHPPK